MIVLHLLKSFEMSINPNDIGIFRWIDQHKSLWNTKKKQDKTRTIKWSRAEGGREMDLI